MILAISSTAKVCLDLNQKFSEFLDCYKSGFYYYYSLLSIFVSIIAIIIIIVLIIIIIIIIIRIIVIIIIIFIIITIFIPDSIIFTACEDQRFPVTYIKTKNRTAVKRIQEDRKQVLLSRLLL